MAIAGLEEIAVQNLNRAMDFLLEADKQFQKDVYYSVTHIFNLEVDLIYLDSTSTYFEIEEKDEFRKKVLFVKEQSLQKSKIITLVVTP